MKFFFNLLINQTDYLQIDTFKKSDDSDDSRAHFKYYVQRKKKSKKRINDFLLAQTSKEPKASNYTVILNNYDTFSWIRLFTNYLRTNFFRGLVLHLRRGEGENGSRGTNSETISGHDCRDNRGCSLPLFTPRLSRGEGGGEKMVAIVKTFPRWRKLAEDPLYPRSQIQPRISTAVELLTFEPTRTFYPCYRCN